MGYDVHVCVYNSYGHRAIFDLPFVSTFSYKNERRSYGSRMSPQIVRRYRTDPVRCPYGVPINFDTIRKEAAR